MSNTSTDDCFAMITETEFRALQEARLPQGARFLYAVLKLFRRRQYVNKVWPSRALLSEYTGLSLSQISRYLTLLEKAGMISRQRRRGSTVYTFLRCADYATSDDAYSALRCDEYASMVCAKPHIEEYKEEKKKNRNRKENTSFFSSKKEQKPEETQSHYSRIVEYAEQNGIQTDLSENEEAQVMRRVRADYKDVQKRVTQLVASKLKNEGNGHRYSLVEILPGRERSF